MTRDMTTGSPLSRILAFCVPLLIGNIFQQFYNLADSILVGRILGVNSFAAVGATGALNFLILGFAQGACSGFTIPVAQSFGAGDDENVRCRTGQVIWLGAIVTALITLCTALWTGDILRLMDTPADIFDEAYRYIFIIFMGTGFTMLYNLAAGLLRALGDSRTPLGFLVAAVTVNVVLDLLFLAKLGMGVEGAAWATVLSQAIAGVACVVYIAKKVPALRLQRGDLRPRMRTMSLIASVGVPMGLQFSITAVGSIFMQSAVNSLGAGAVAAVSAGSRVHNIVAAPLETGGVVMATYNGQNLGAGRIDRIRQGTRDMVILSFLYCGAGFVVNYIWGGVIAQLFIDVSEKTVLAEAHRYLVYMSAFYPLLALVFLLRNGLQGMGFSSQAMLAGIAELVARTLVAFGFVGRFGFQAVCYANPVAWLFADVILVALYRREIRRLDSEPALLLRCMQGSKVPRRRLKTARNGS